MMNSYFQVAFGGAIGATARFAVNRAAAGIWPGFPAATLLVNVLGSFLMGLLAALMAHRIGNAYAAFLLTGVLGGFTTFSAFSLDTLTLWERGQGASAAVYVVSSVVLSLLAVLAGMALVKGVWA